MAAPGPLRPFKRSPRAGTVGALLLAAACAFLLAAAAPTAAAQSVTGYINFPGPGRSNPANPAANSLCIPQTAVNLPALGVYDVTLTGYWMNGGRFPRDAAFVGRCPGNTAASGPIFDSVHNFYGYFRCNVNGATGGTPDLLEWVKLAESAAAGTVFVNGQFVDWGSTYSPVQTYTKRLTFTTSPVLLGVRDTLCEDNIDNVTTVDPNIRAQAFGAPGIAFSFSLVATATATATTTTSQSTATASETPTPSTTSETPTTTSETQTSSTTSQTSSTTSKTTSETPTSTSETQTPSTTSETQTPSTTTQTSSNTAAPTRTTSRSATRTRTASRTRTTTIRCSRRNGRGKCRGSGKEDEDKDDKDDKEKDDDDDGKDD
ncbi:hypothetical protein DFJ74DRAFT_725045 [Hyaloraphidium curvatum]|nr:hypothetical protein DFJ74DRAFT_725045 [Hyaloraphidium curvatum]